MISSERDLPLYNGRPVEIEGIGWLFLMASVMIAFLALIFIPMRSFPYNIVPALLFAAIPLMVLRRAAGSCWKCLFRPINRQSLALMVLFGLITVIGSLATGWMLQRYFELRPNPMSDAFATMSTVKIGETFVVTCIQLFGEELLGILPFLGILWFCVRRLHMARTPGIVIALIMSGLLFGAAHLPTYAWHWAQSLIGIGVARTLLTLAFIATRNIWVSTGAHIINDWTGFVLAIGLGHFPINP